MSAPENPPAFPSQAFGSDGLPMEAASYGMDLRDWFAGGIASGMAAHSGTSGLSYGPGDMARRSYEIADAMLAERAKGGAK